MFAIRPKAILHLPAVTVDVTVELQKGVDVDVRDAGYTTFSDAAAGDNNARWRLRQTLEVHTGYVWSVAFSHDSEPLASGSGDSTIRLWNTATWQSDEIIRGHGASFVSVAFTHDSERLVSASK